mmetsp:Transcript_11577/g.40524  ORF Transcript_11577/g.40524 Transcript_11577/m.40524 type:complete len:325 (-) Transcript_11577:511-1485(-)
MPAQRVERAARAARRRRDLRPILWRRPRRHVALARLPGGRGRHQHRQHVLHEQRAAVPLCHRAVPRAAAVAVGGDAHAVAGGVGGSAPRVRSNGPLAAADAAGWPAQEGAPRALQRFRAAGRLRVRADAYAPAGGAERRRRGPRRWWRRALGSDGDGGGGPTASRQAHCGHLRRHEHDAARVLDVRQRVAARRALHGHLRLARRVVRRARRHGAARRRRLAPPAALARAARGRHGVLVLRVRHARRRPAVHGRHAAAAEPRRVAVALPVRRGGASAAQAAQPCLLPAHPLAATRLGGLCDEGAGRGAGCRRGGGGRGRVRGACP